MEMNEISSSLLLRLVLCVVICVTCAGSVNANDEKSYFNEMVRGCKKLNYSKEFEEVYDGLEGKEDKILSESEVEAVVCAAKYGDVSAQNFLGYAFYTGRFLKKDVRNAIYWMMMSASSGNYESIMFLFSVQLVGVGKKSEYEYFKIIDGLIDKNNYAALYVGAVSYCLGVYTYPEDKRKCDEMLSNMYSVIDKESKRRLMAAVRDSDLKGSIKSYLFAKYMDKGEE